MHLNSYIYDFILITLWLTSNTCLLYTGVSVFPIGLGNQYDQTELSTLAGRHAQDNIIRLSSTEYLLAMAALDQSFTDKLCRGETHIHTHTHTHNSIKQGYSTCLMMMMMMMMVSLSGSSWSVCRWWWQWTEGELCFFRRMLYSHHAIKLPWKTSTLQTSASNILPFSLLIRCRLSEKQPIFHWISGSIISFTGSGVLDQ